MNTTNELNARMASQVPQWWGMAGVFPGELGVYNEGDVWLNKLNFVADRGFHGAGIGAAALLDDAKVRVLADLCQNKGQSYFVHMGVDLRADSNTEAARLLELSKKHIEMRQTLDLPLVQVARQGGWHRFSPDFPLEDQMTALANALGPMVDYLVSQGVPVAIENHGDYYMSDLVELCGRVPGLTLMFDTGNCFLIGERPDLIPDEAYPLISCTHFKDHHVAPHPGQPLHFQLSGATLGEGAVGLDAIYEKMLRLHPDPASIRLMIEWVPDTDKCAVQCLNDSMDYLAKLSCGNFKPNHFTA